MQSPNYIQHMACLIIKVAIKICQYVADNLKQTFMEP